MLFHRWAFHKRGQLKEPKSDALQGLMAKLTSTANHEGWWVRFLLTSGVFLVHPSPVTVTCRGVGGIRVNWLEREQPNERLHRVAIGAKRENWTHEELLLPTKRTFLATFLATKNGEVTSSWPLGNDPSQSYRALHDVAE